MLYSAKVWQHKERGDNVSQEEWLTVEEVAALLKVSAETVRRWIAGGKLRAAKPGGKEWRISRAALAEMMETA